MSKWQEKTKPPGAADLSGGAGVAGCGAGAAHLHAGRAGRRGGHQRGRAYLAGTKSLPHPASCARQVPYATGSEDVDAMLNGITANLDALHELNDAIPDTAAFPTRWTAWKRRAAACVGAVEGTPDKGAAVSTVLPATTCPRVVKLMGAYADAGKERRQGR